MSHSMGHKIKLIRKELGLTMQEFGKEFYPPASDSIVSRWERGSSLPNNARLKKIAELGKTTVDELLESEFKSCDICDYQRIKDGFKYCPICGNELKEKGIEE